MFKAEQCKFPTQIFLKDSHWFYLVLLFILHGQKIPRVAREHHVLALPTGIYCPIRIGGRGTRHIEGQKGTLRTLYPEEVLTQSKLGL